MTGMQAKSVRVGQRIRDRRDGRLLVVQDFVYRLALNAPISAFVTDSGDVPVRSAEVIVSLGTSESPPASTPQANTPKEI